MRGISISQKLLWHSHCCCRRFATSTTTVTVQEDLKKSVVLDDSKGIFGIDILKNASSFRLYYAEIYAKNFEIKKAILEKAKNPDPRDYTDKTFIQLVDELSNELTTAYLVASTIHQLHSDLNWASYAKKYIAAFREMKENLKNNMDIYDALKFSLKTDIGWIDSVDVKAIESYLREFEEFGAHLDLDDERLEIVELQSRLNYMSETFLKGCNTTNDNVKIYQLARGFFIGKLSGMKYRNSMVLDRAGMKRYYKNLNKTPKNFREFWSDLDRHRITHYLINFQESWRHFSIRPWLGVDRKRLVEELSERPKPKFTRWVYNKFLLEENDNQEYYLRRIVRDRHKIAKITGYESFAHRAQENTILGSYDATKNFLEGIIKEFKPYVEPELKEISKRVGKSRLEESDIEFALEASRYQSDMSKANLEKVAKFFRFDEFLRGLTIFFERLYGVKVRLGRAERGESWETAELKIEICTQKDELLGVIYINADVRTKPFGRITLSEWNLDNTKDVQFYVVRRPKLLQNGECQTPISVVSFTMIPDDPNDPHVYLSPRTAKNFFREVGHAMNLIMSRPRHQIFSGSGTSPDMHEIPAFLMEHFFHNFNILSIITCDGLLRLTENEANLLSEAKYTFGCIKILREAINTLFDLELYGTSAFDYINDDSITSTDLYRTIYKTALPQVELKKKTSPQQRIHDLVLRPAQSYSSLVARSCASLIWHSQFEQDVFSKVNGQKWAEVQSKFGELSSQDLLKKYLGYVPGPNQLIETLKKDVVREAN